jgi:hypothetical protein
MHGKPKNDDDNVMDVLGMFKYTYDDDVWGRSPTLIHTCSFQVIHGKLCIFSLCFWGLLTIITFELLISAHDETKAQSSTRKNTIEKLVVLIKGVYCSCLDNKRAMFLYISFSKFYYVCII